MQNPTTINLTTSVNFTLNVTDFYGCSDNDDIFVNVSGPLTVDAIATPDTVCIGQPVQLMALAGGGSGSYTYNWISNPAGFAATIQNPYALPAVNTVYSVFVNDGITSVNDNVSVTVIPLPDLPGKPDGPDTVNLSYVISSDYTIVPVAGADSYSWALFPISSGIITGSGTTGTANWNPGFQGIATIKVLAMNTCGESEYSPLKNTFVDHVTGISESETSSVVIYPNPNDGSFYIRSDKMIDKVVIRDMLGRTIDQIDNPADGYRFNYTLSNGTYFVQIFGKDYNVTRKIIIQNGK